jgi:hypothetical protein
MIAQSFKQSFFFCILRAHILKPIAVTPNARNTGYKTMSAMAQGLRDSRKRVIANPVEESMPLNVVCTAGLAPGKVIQNPWLISS